MTVRQITGLVAISSVIGFTAMAGGDPMTDVQPLLLEKLQEAGTSPVPVLLVCEDNCQLAEKALAQTGVKITGKDSASLGILNAEITSEQLQSVQSLTGITAVEFDEEAQIFSQ